MTRLFWGDAGHRIYEVGVDRGVLYAGNDPGVPWNGLVSITESPSGAEPKDYYQDGVKYLSVSVGEEFGATIEAFTYPVEFSKCDGTRPVKNGLFAGQQTRVPFGLCYRTKLGNEISGSDYAYKIHIVYNALASPSERSRNTAGESVEAALFSWGVTTRPPPLAGYNATAHFEIDSRSTPEKLLARIEAILYGSAVSPARIPPVDELVELFENFLDIPDPDPYVPPGDGLTIIDGQTPSMPAVTFIDAGNPTAIPTYTYDGGTP